MAEGMRPRMAEGTCPSHTEIINEGSLYAADLAMMNERFQGKLIVTSRARPHEPRQLKIRCLTHDDSQIEEAVAMAYKGSFPIQGHISKIVKKLSQGLPGRVP